MRPLEWRRLAPPFLVGAAILWGLRLTILEGFVYEWPRAFSGDFAAAMYESRWWDGTGIMYGPVFVMERWLVNAWPHVFTVRLFALANIPLVAAAFVLSAAAAGTNRAATSLALAAWLCFRALYLAFSVSANPEILELTLLCVVWYAVSRRAQGVAWTAAALGALTKVIPIIFVPLLLMLRPSRRGIAAGGATALLVLAAVGFGQRLSPAALASAILIPAQNKDDGVAKLQIAHIEAVPSANTMVGLNSALARALRLSDDDRPSLARVETVTNVLTIAVYVTAIGAAWRLLRRRHALPETARLSLAFGLFFALMPLMTFHTHPHTFVFLLPAWTAVIAVARQDVNRRRAGVFGLICLAAYVGAGLPAAVAPLDRWAGTHLAVSPVFADPIWASLALIGTLCSYAALL
jgi:hypothetical protein